MSDRESFVIYDVETGEERWRAQGNPGDAARQELPEGLAAAVVPQIALATVPADIQIIKDYYRAVIDMGAGRFRMQFITDVPGQAQTYERKEAEARAWHEGADPADFPFIVAEAGLRGVSIQTVCDEVLAKVNELMPIAAAIEARRLFAKQAVTDASSIGAIVAASKVSWQSVLLTA